MKLKHVITTACIILHCIPSFGQRQQVSEAYTPSTGFPMSGNRSYSYIIGEDGSNLKDGVFSITAKPEAFSVRKGYVTYKLSGDGSYKVNTSFKNNMLNGAFTFSYNITMTSQDIRGGSGIEKHSVSYVGGFSDGLPHGLFNIAYNTEYTIKLKAQYDKGTLVGAYSCTCINDGLPVIINGVLSSKGELIGKWTTQDIKGHTTYEFQNGILIRESNDESGSTKPNVTELAKKFAAGTISKEELFEHNILVCEDELPLGDYAKQVALWHNEVLDFESIGGYDFRNTNSKKYLYLKEINRLTDEGFELYTKMIEENLKNGDPAIKDFHYGELSDKGNVIHKVCFDGWENYVRGTIGKYAWSADVYLSKDQAETWNEMLNEAKKQHAITFGIATVSHWERYLRKYFENPDNEFSYYDYEGMRKEAIEKIKNGADGILSEFSQVPNEPNYLIKNEGNSSVFVKKETADRDIAMIYLLAGAYDELVKGVNEEKRSQLEELRKEFDTKLVSNLKKPIDPIMERLLNQSATSIAYDENADKFFSPEGLSEDLWRLEFSKNLKPFGKIIGYEIVNFHGEYYDEVECIITTLGKKKVQNKYKVTWKLDRENRSDRIIANSIDINNAILATNE